MPSIALTRVIINVLLLASAVSGLLIIAVALTWIFQERIAFQPPRGPWPGSDSATRVDYFARDRQPLFAYVVGDKSAPAGLLLCFHGNADLALWQLDWAEEVNRRTGVTVMLAEYRGYMGLAGRSTYETSQLDAMAAYRFAREELNVPANRIALYGHSLGSAIATELAAKHQPAALLLQSPFTSAREMAKRMTGYSPSLFLWRLVSRLHFDTGARVAQLQAPVSVAHGGQDRLIPTQMGEEVFRVTLRKGDWLLVPAAAHNDVAAMGGESYWSWIDNALKPLTASTITD